MEVISNLLRRRKTPKELVSACSLNLNLIAVEGNLGSLEDKVFSIFFKTFSGVQRSKSKTLNF
jgi:hypothetical protein